MSKKTGDRGYKSIFSDPLMLWELLETCVDEPWVKELDSSTVELMATEFVDKRLIASSQDLLFKVNFKDRPALLVVMLEFQTKPDKYMALRVLHYLCTVYLSLLGRDKKERENLLRGGKLPPVFPVVLYKGKRVWRAPKEMSELIDLDCFGVGGGGGEGGEGDGEGGGVEGVEGGEGEVGGRRGGGEEGGRGGKWGSFGDYVPRFRYMCIDQRRVPEAVLEKKGTLVSALFLMERLGRDGIESTEEELARLAEYIEPHLGSGEGKRAVARLLDWLRILTGLGKLDEGGEVVAKLETMVEVKTMLEETLEKMRDKARHEGRHEGEILGVKKGRHEGRQEGRQEGRMEQKLETARKLLNKGHTPKEVAELMELPEEEVRKLLH